MEESETEHIDNNLDDLAQNTRCEGIFLPFFSSRKFLSLDELEELESLRNYPTRQNLMLYKLLKTRVGAYAILLDALHQTNQSGAYDILTRFRNEHPKSKKFRRVQKYSSAPNGLEEFLKETDYNLMIINSLDCDITIQRIQDTLEVPCCLVEFDSFNKSSKHVCGNLKKLFIMYSIPEQKLSEDYVTQLCRDYEKVVLITTENCEAVKSVISSWNTFSSDDFAIETENISWNDLSEPFQDEVLQRTCKLTMESEPKTLQDFMNMTIELGNDDKLTNYLEGSLLVDMINNEIPPLFHDIIPPSLSYYIPRKILSRRVISLQKLFKLGNLNDIFVYSGIENERQLSSLLPKGYRVVDSDSVISRRGDIGPTIHHILLIRRTDFEVICKKTRYSIHWLEHNKAGELVWIKSRGSVTTVQKLLEGKQNEFDEEDFLEKIVLAESSQPIVISDTAGMGKSVLLLNIAKKLKKVCSNKLVLFLVISDFIHSLKTKDLKSSSEVTEHFLDTLCFKVTNISVFAKKLLKLGIQSGSIQVELFFDGFDEVLSEDMSLAQKVLLEINNSFKTTRIFITTRPHLLLELEKLLSVMGHNILPFSDQNQSHFLQTYWKFKNPHLEMERLEEFSLHCLNCLKKCLKDKDMKIAGIPLQCLLIGEVYEQDAVAHSTPGNLLSMEGGREPLVINRITDLYERLIEKKFQLYCNKYLFSLPIIDSEKETLMNIHVHQSLCVIFPDFVNSFLKLKRMDHDCSKDNLEILVRIGLLERRGTQESPTFIHRSFAEYFIAWFCSNLISTWNQSFSDPLDWFLDTVLIPTNIGFSLEKISSRTFKHLEILNIFNSLLSIDTIEEPDYHTIASQIESKILPENRSNIALACAHDDTLEILQFLVNCHVFRGAELEIFNDNYVYVMISQSSLEFIETVMEHCREWNSSFKMVTVAPFDNDSFNLVTDQHSPSLSPLHTAVRRGDYSIVDYLISEGFHEWLEKMEDSRASSVIHVCIENTYEYEDEENGNENKISQRLEILERLWKISKDLIHACSKVLPLFCICIHIRLLLKIISLGVDIFARNADNGGTLLHHHSSNLNSDEYHKLISSISKADFSHLLKISNSLNSRFLERSLLIEIMHWFDPLPETLKLFSECNADFNAVSIKKGRTVLCVAIEKRRSEDCIKQLISYGALCSSGVAVNTENETVLHVAARYDHLTALRLFLEVEKNPNVSCQDKRGNTPLHSAVFRGKKYEDGEKVRFLSEIVQILTENGADLAGTKCSEQKSVLHMAAKHGSPEDVQFCLDRNADIRSKDKKGNTVVHYAVQNRKRYFTLDILRILEVYEASIFSLVNGKGQGVLHLAAQYGNLKTVRYLIENKQLFIHGKDEKDNSVLHYAVTNEDEKDREEIVKYLVTKGADVDAVNKLLKTPLLKALNLIVDGDEDFLKFLLVRSKNPSEAATMAVQQSILSITFKPTFFLLCVSSGADIQRRDSNGKNLIHLAITTDILQAVELILENGGESLVNEEDNLGRTPLYYALNFLNDEQCNLVKMLLNYRADLNKERSRYNELCLANKVGLRMNTVQELFQIRRDFFEDTLTLQLSIRRVITEKGDVEFLKTLAKVSQEALQYKDEKGRTFLHFAAHHGYPEGVNFLLEKGVDVNIQDNKGNTPLHVALVPSKSVLSFNWEYDEVIKTLIEKGGDLNITNNKGLSPLAMGVKKKSEICMRALTVLISKGCISSSEPYWLTIALKYVLTKDTFTFDQCFASDLVKRGADVNYSDEKGKTLLHLAVRKRDFSMVSFLTENGASVNVEDNHGNNPLMSISCFHPISVENSEYQVKHCHDSHFQKCEAIIQHMLQHGANLKLRETNNHGIESLEGDISTENP